MHSAVLGCPRKGVHNKRKPYHTIRNAYHELMMIVLVDTKSVHVKLCLRSDEAGFAIYEYVYA